MVYIHNAHVLLTSKAGTQGAEQHPIDLTVDNGDVPMHQEELSTVRP